MGLFGVVLTALNFFFVWYYWARLLPEYRAIEGCLHKTGHVVGINDHNRKNYHLQWVCKECNLQHPLKELKALPAKDIFWFMDGHEVWKDEHFAAIKAAGELDPHD